MQRRASEIYDMVIQKRAEVIKKMNEGTNIISVLQVSKFYICHIRPDHKIINWKKINRQGLRYGQFKPIAIFSSNIIHYHISKFRGDLFVVEKAFSD